MAARISSTGAGWTSPADSIEADAGKRLDAKHASRRPADAASRRTTSAFPRTHARWKWNMRVRRRDGEYRWTCVPGRAAISAPTANSLGYVGSAIDLTERRQHEAALKRSEARYRDVVESQVALRLPPAAGWHADVRQLDLLPLPRLARACGCWARVSSTCCRSRRALRPARRSTRPLSGAGQAAWECEVAHPDGTRGWQSWVCHVLDAGPDEAREIQAIGYDVTDRKRAEESGRQLAHATRFAAVGELDGHGGARDQPAAVRHSQQRRGRRDHAARASSRRSTNCGKSSPTSARTTCVPTRPFAASVRCCSGANSSRGPWTSWPRCNMCFKLTAGDALHRRVTDAARARRGLAAG